MFELHRLLLKDSVRNAAFTRAIQEAVKPGKTVVADIGSGTGYLSFQASRAGAARCMLYEQSPDLLKLSKTLAKANGIENCTFVPGHSTSLHKPEKADLVISETLGNFAYEENIIEIMNDAVRFLKPGAVLIPQKIRQLACPVVSSRLYDELDLHTLDGMDFTAANIPCLNNMYVKDITPDDLLEKGKCAKEWDSVDLRQKNESVRKGELDWKITTVMTMYGLALWWECDLDGRNTISTDPSKPATHWKQIFLPLLKPLTVPKGHIFCASIKSDTRWEVKINVEWEAAVKEPDAKQCISQKMDMRKGYMA